MTPANDKGGEVDYGKYEILLVKLANPQVYGTRERAELLDIIKSDVELAKQSERLLADQRVAQERARGDARVAAVIGAVEKCKIDPEDWSDYDKLSKYQIASRAQDQLITSATQADSDFIRLNP